MRGCAKIGLMVGVLMVGGWARAAEDGQDKERAAGAPARAGVDPQRAAKAAAEMARAANNLLATYSDEQRKAGVFELSDEERVNWHFIPKTRKGLPFKEMS